MTPTNPPKPFSPAQAAAREPAYRSWRSGAAADTSPGAHPSDAGRRLAIHRWQGAPPTSAPAPGGEPGTAGSGGNVVAFAALAAVAVLIYLARRGRSRGVAGASQAPPSTGARGLRRGALR